MTRRTIARNSLIAAVALVLAPSLALAGGSQGARTNRTAPVQFKNWSSDFIGDVTISHYHGASSETFNVGYAYPGATIYAGTAHFVTGAGLSQADYWTVTYNVNYGDGERYQVYRSLQRYDLQMDDAGVMVTFAVQNGPFFFWTLNDIYLDIYSNDTCVTELPMALRGY